MRKPNKSEDVAAALIRHQANEAVLELGRLLVDRNRSNRFLRRHFRRIGINRAALNVPVFEKGNKDENSNVIELTNVVTNCRDANRVRHLERLAGEFQHGTRVESE